MALDQDKIQSGVMDVLKYIDSPFKLAVVVLLAALGFGGWFAWSNQEIFIGAYMRQLELPKLNSSRFDDAARLLSKSTGADLVVIMSVNSMLNTRTVDRMYLKDGTRAKEFDDKKIPLFSRSEANNRDVVSLMASEIPCSDYKTPQSELGYFYISQGITYMCRISAPPTIDAFVGQISVGWKTKPAVDPSNFLIIAADMISKK